MRNRVAFASMIIACLSAAPAALAQEQSSRLSYEAGAATSTVFEDLAYEIPGPIVFGSVSADLGRGFTVDAYAQAGDEDESREIDLTLGWERDAGPVLLYAEAGVQLYPSGGSDTTYVVSAGAEIPLGPVSLDLAVDRYAGGFESTVYSAALSGSVGPADVSVGRAYNDTDEDYAPWFARVSVPVGSEELGVRFGVRAFAGADSGVVAELLIKR